jgi:hypothetical protein
MTLLRAAFAGWLLLAAASVPAAAQAPAAGTKNFDPPNSVPNYFSNEAGPFRGGAGAETTYSSSGPAVVPSTPRERVAAAPGRSAPHHAARAGRRVHLAHAHGRPSRHAARARTAKTRMAALRAGRTHAKAAASRRGSTKVAAAKRSAAKKHPAGTRHRPSSKRVAHTASR